MRRRLLVASASILFAGAAALAGISGPARAAAGSADAPKGVLSANVESYVARVEYDIPLPVGTGTIGQVVGEVRSSDAGANAKGLAASPSALDPVVGGKFSDPQGSGHPQNRYPQTECFYPGSLVDTSFFFPTDERKETAGVPAAGYATARCDAGPLVQLRSRVGTAGDPRTFTATAGPALGADTFTSDALARPDKGVLSAVTSSQGSNLSILNGAITVGSVVARGESQISGLPGGGASSAVVSISDIKVAGTTFSLNSKSDNGKETLELTSGGQSFALDSGPAKAVIDATNAALRPQGCSLSPLSSPGQYPQGFLFARPEPAVGVAADGTLAASYRGGLLVICDIPKSLSEPTTFSPQRAQILIGFAYTGAALRPGEGGLAIGGFQPGDLLSGAAPSQAALDVPTAPTLPLALTGSPAPVAAPAPAPAEQAAPAAPTMPAAAVLPRHLAAGTKVALAMLSLLLWLPLTHLGATRLRSALEVGSE